MSEIDKKITQIQQSTRTSFAVFLPLHERLRMRFGWYYNWHLKRGSRWVHLGILALYILVLGAFGLFSYKTVVPLTAKADVNYQVTNTPGSGGFEGGPYVDQTGNKYKKDDTHWLVLWGTGPFYWIFASNDHPTNPGDWPTAYYQGQDAGGKTPVGVNFQPVGGYQYPSPTVAEYTPPAGITISGTAYTDDAKSGTINSCTNCVGLSINGGAKALVSTDGSGVFSYASQTVAANDTITLYLTGGTYTGNLVTQAIDAATNITSQELYANDVALTNQNAAPMTNTLLATANDCADCGTDIKFTDSAGAVTFTTAYKVWVVSGKEYKPGNTVTADALTIVGTFTPEANSITLAGTGTPLVITGTFTPGSSTINYTGGTTATNVTSTTYYNLYLNHASTTYTAAGDITVSGVLTIHAGTFNASDKTITLSGSGTPFVKTGIFTPSTSTFAYTGSGATSIAAATYNNLTFNNGTGSWTIGGNVIANSTVTMNAGTLTLGDNVQSITSNSLVINNGAITIVDQGVPGRIKLTTNSYSQAAGTSTFTVGEFSIVNINGALMMSGGTYVNRGWSRTYVSGNCDMAAGTVNSSDGGTFYFNGNNAVFTPSGSTYGSIHIAKTANQTLTIGGDITTAGSFIVDSGLLNAGTYRLTMTGSAESLNLNGQSLYDLTISNNIFATSGVISKSLTVTGTGRFLTINAGQTFTILNGATVTMGTTNSISGGTLILIDSAGANLTTSGGIDSVVRFQAETGNVVIPNRNYGRSIVAYNGTSTPYVATLGTATTPAFTIGSQSSSGVGSVVVQAEGSGAMTLDASAWNPNITLLSHFQDSATTSGGIYFSGAGAGIKTLSAGNGTWTMRGSINLTGGVLTAGNSTFVLNGESSNVQNITSVGNSFKNLTISNTTTAGVTFVDGATVTGTFRDTTQSSKLVFNSGSTYAFNTVNIAGTSGHLITLAPSGATNWILNPTTVTTVTYVDVSKSTNSGTSFCATYSNDSGGNIGWHIGVAGSCQTAAPTNVAISGIDSTYFDVTWMDNSSDETGFKVFISTVPNAVCSAATYPETSDYTAAAGAESQHVTGKSINTQYCTKVITTGPNGDSDPAFAASPKYTLANVPSAPTVTGDYSVGSGYHEDITINPNSNPAGTNYWIQYSTNGTDYSDPAGMAWQTGTTYTLSSLNPNTQYWFKIKAKNGDAVDTVYSSAGADVTPPAAPLSLNTSNICSTTASTSWAAATGADKYTFSYGTDVDATNLGTTGNLTDTSHNLTSLTDGETYYWKVSATSDTNGTGAYSAIEHFTSGTCLAPIAPSDFNGSAASTTQINWTWSDTTGETGWKVEDENHTDLHDLPVDSTSWNETALSANTVYTRHVNAFNTFGSNDSNQKTVYTLANKPSAPTVSAVALGIKIIVNKNGNPDANTRYAIYNQTESKYVKHADGTLQADPDWQFYADWGGASGFVNTGLSPNVTNSYQVKAENGDDIETALSDASSVYTFANQPSAPTVNATSVSSLTVIINQNSNPAGTNFAIRETSTGKYVQVDGTLGVSSAWQDYTTWGDGTGIAVTGLFPDIGYSFEVKAENNDDIETDMSDPVTKHTLANKPDAPTVSTVSSSVIKIVVNRNSNPTNTRYAIYNQTESKYVKHADGTLQADPDWQLYADWGGAGGFNNTGLAAGTSYSYQVKAENGDDTQTALSDAASANTSYPTVGFSASTASASISHAANTLTVNLSGVSGTDVSVDYAATGGTAVAGVDYTFVDGTANIAHGQTGVNINLTLINDHLVGSNKTIVFTLSNPVNTSLGTYDTLTFTIINDNLAPSGSFAIDGGAAKTNNRTLNLALTYNLATQVKISTDPAFGGAAYEAIAASKSYTLPDVDAAYTIYIKLKDQYGNESGSYSNNITLDRVAPSVPANLAAQGGNRTISLSWTNPPEADFTYVRVYRGLSAGFDIAHAAKTFDVYKPGATYVDSDVINNKEYYYKVTASDDIGNESAASAEVNARADSDNPTTPGKPSISQPTKEYNGKIYTTENGIDFSWTASTDVNSGLEGYYLTIATTSGGNDVLNAQQIAPTQTSYRYDFASDGIYFVRVYAKDNKGNRSADSDEYIFYIDKSAPSDVSNILMYDASDRSNGTYAVALSWKSSTDDVSGLKGYVILRDGTALNLNADNMTQNIVTDENSGSSFYLDILSADAKASYSIKAVDNASNETSAQDALLAATSLTSTTGQSAGSTQIELPATVIGEGKLDITDVKVTPSEVVSDKTQAKVTWKTGVPATSQVMYGTSTSYELKTELDTGFNSTHTVILSDLNPSAAYHLKVVSKDKNGRELSSSDQTFSTGGKARDKSILEIITGTLSDAFTRMWNSISGFFTTGASAADNMAAIDTLSVVDISTDEQPGFAIFWPLNKGTVSVERESGGGFVTVGTTNQNFYLDLTIKEKGNYSYRVGDLTAAAADELSGKSTISDIKITAGAVDKKEASVIVFFKTDKLAKGQVSYGEGSPSSQTEPEDGLNQSHTILIEKLKPSTTYTFSLKATDKSGSQITTSSAQTYTTPASPRDMTILEIIIKALQNAFSGFDQFMKK